MNTISRSQTAVTLDQAMNRRLLLDKLFKHSMSVGGIGVIIAVSAIFFYLASVVVPLFAPPRIEHQTRFAVPGDTAHATAAFSGEEQREIGARVDAAGNVTFFRFNNGEVLSSAAVPIPETAHITSFALGDRSSFSFGYGLSDGRVVVAKQAYEVTFPEGSRLIAPKLEFPLGEEPVLVDKRTYAISQLGVQHTDDGTTIAALTADGRLLVSAVTVTSNLMTGEKSSEVQQSEIAAAPAGVRQIIIESRQRELLVLHGDRELTRYDIADKANPTRLETVQISSVEERVAMIGTLSGGFSIIVGTDSGKLSQWFPVRQESNIFRLTKIRDFKDMPVGITAMAPEFFRKGFIVGDAQGNLGSYYATSRRTVH
jgi:phosphate transport system permease protein